MSKYQVKTHRTVRAKIAELISEEVVLRSVEDSLDLIGNLSYQGYEKIIIHEANIVPAFFDLKTGLAGEILQKHVQYRMPLIIVGDFSKYNSESLQSFIFESNRGNQINFVSSLSEFLDPE